MKVSSKQARYKKKNIFRYFDDEYNEYIFFSIIFSIHPVLFTFNLFYRSIGTIAIQNIIGEVPDYMKRRVVRNSPPFPVVFFSLTLVKTKDP